MTIDRWMEVKTRVLLAIGGLRDDDSGKRMAFKRTEWQKGVKVVNCSRRSKDFFVGVVESCGET